MQKRFRTILKDLKDVENFLKSFIFQWGKIWVEKATYLNKITWWNIRRQSWNILEKLKEKQQKKFWNVLQYIHENYNVYNVNALQAFTQLMMKNYKPCHSDVWTALVGYCGEFKRLHCANTQVCTLILEFYQHKFTYLCCNNAIKFSLITACCCCLYSISALASVTVRSPHIYTEHMQIQNPIEVVFPSCFMHVFSVITAWNTSLKCTRDLVNKIHYIQHKKLSGSPIWIIMTDDSSA